MPGYQRLAKDLSQRILCKAIASGERLPRERDLAAQTGLSRSTVRAALKILESQGLVRRVRGWGTFVCRRHEIRRWRSTASTVLLAQASPDLFDNASTYYGQIQVGASRMAHKLGLTVKRRRVYGYCRVPLAEYNLPKPEEVGGVILCGTSDPQYIGMYQSEGVPLVVADCWIHDQQTDCVAVDLEAEAYAAVDYLADHGHQTLGFIASGRQEPTSELRGYEPDIPRLLGYLRMAAQRRGVEMRDEWILLASQGAQIPQLVRELVGLRQRPTAALCFNDWIACKVLREVKDRMVRCPEDISIIGRGGGDLGKGRITSFRVNPGMMGRLAVRLLTERMGGDRQEPVRVAMVSTLIKGSTTGPAPR